jgi:ATP-dependent DNA ligase
MLARLERTLPRGDLWRYEPKLDGFRGLLWRASSGSVHLLSKNLKDLSHAFPEVVTAGRDLPLDTLVDGEIVIADAGGQSNFGALQERLGKARRDAAREAVQSPAVLLAFDLVRDAGVELVDQPLGERRRRLEALLGPRKEYLQLVAQTASVEEAEDWLRFVPGLEGVVAKRCGGRYAPGQRDWVKVKRQRTADCAVIGIAGDRAQPALVLGLRHPDGRLHHFGLARPSQHMLSPQLVEVLAQAGPEQRPIESRWQHAAVPAWCPVPPTAVCEVAYTLLDGARWLRMPARFIRWRPDRSPDDCWLDQLAET